MSTYSRDPRPSMDLCSPQPPLGAAGMGRSSSMQHRQRASQQCLGLGTTAETVAALKASMAAMELGDRCVRRRVSAQRGYKGGNQPPNLCITCAGWQPCWRRAWRRQLTRARTPSCKCMRRMGCDFSNQGEYEEPIAGEGVEAALPARGLCCTFSVASIRSWAGLADCEPCYGAGSHLTPAWQLLLCSCCTPGAPGWNFRGCRPAAAAPIRGGEALLDGARPSAWTVP